MTTGLTDKQLDEAYQRAYEPAFVGSRLDSMRATQREADRAGLRAVADLAITAQEAENAGLQREIDGLQMRITELEKDADL